MKIKPVYGGTGGEGRDTIEGIRWDFPQPIYPTRLVYLHSWLVAIPPSHPPSLPTRPSGSAWSFWARPFLALLAAGHGILSAVDARLYAVYYIAWLCGPWVTMRIYNSLVIGLS